MDDVQLQAECVRLLDESSEIAEGFPYPGWNKIWHWIRQNVSEDDDAVFWHAVFVEWADRIARNLGSEYKLSESEYFLLVSAEGEELDDRLLNFAEYGLSKILRAFGAIFSQGGFVAPLILMFHDTAAYWRYCAHFMHRNKSAVSVGMFIHDGYGHIVLAPQPEFHLENTLFHELVHNCLAHLSLPLWLNEGLTHQAEVAGGYERPMQLDAETAQRHWNYWDRTKIQSFWRGWSFSRADEGSELSYGLAAVLIKLILSDVAPGRWEFEQFVLNASQADGGEAAARQYLNRSLGEIAVIFLGQGDWSPKPESWPGAEKKHEVKTEEEN